MNKKIVINSNVKYDKPLSVCIKSLCNVGFRDFDNLIIIRNGTKHDTSPETVRLSTVINTTNEQRVTLVCSKSNNLDVTGFDVLFNYKEHPLIKSKSYLYLPDTTTFQNSFCKKYELLRVDYNEIRTCRSPHSFVCAFGYGIIEEYKNAFAGSHLNKEQVIRLEMWDLIQELSLRSITTFGTRTYSPNRGYLFSAEIYKEDQKRDCFFYPEFGIFKWANGNFKGTYNSLPEDVI